MEIGENLMEVLETALAVFCIVMLWYFMVKKH